MTTDPWTEDAPNMTLTADGELVPYRNPRRTDDPVADEEAARAENAYERYSLGWEGMEPS